MSYPTLTKIRSFVAVARHGRFRKAAESLNISQPALSSHISDLEGYLGVSLLSRTTRSIRLTTEGERFLAHARKLLDDLDRAMADMRDGAALNRGRLAIACVPTVAFHILPPILARYMVRFPNIEIRIIERVAGEVQRRVESGEADFGVVPEPEAGLDLDFVPFARDEFVAVVPASSALAGRRRVTVEDLSRYPFITIEPDSNIRRIVDRLLAEHGIRVAPRLEFQHHHTVAAMIAAGNGVSILPSVVVASLGRSEVAAVRMAEPRIYRRLGILRRRGERPSPPAAAFVAEILDGWNASPIFRAWNKRMRNTLTPIDAGR